MKRFLSLVLIVMMLLTVSAYAESATSTLQEMYAQAELLMATGDYSGAAAKFDALGAYSDASQMAMYCKAIAAAETLGMYEVAVSAFNDLGDFKDSKQMATYYTARGYQAVGDSIDISTASDSDLDLAKFSYDKGAETYVGLALFKDCLTRMSECQTQSNAVRAEQSARAAAKLETAYQAALALEESGEYQKAIDAFKKIQDYKDSKGHITACENAIKEGIYQEALVLEENGEYEDAINIFLEMIDYKDCKEHIYQIALAQCDNKNYDYASSLFKKLSEKAYKDSKSYYDMYVERQSNRKVDYVGYFSEGMINVRKDDLWGYIDAEGFTVLSFQWESAGRFSDGLAWVKQNGKYGCIDVNGNIIIPFEYTHCIAFENGFAYAEKDKIWYKIDKTNKRVEKYTSYPPETRDVLKDKYTKQYVDKWQVNSFVDGYASIIDKKTQKWGCIDDKGKVVFPCEYEGVGFGDGYFALIKNKKLTIVDKAGNVLF